MSYIDRTSGVRHELLRHWLGAWKTQLHVSLASSPADMWGCYGNVPREGERSKHPESQPRTGGMTHLRLFFLSAPVLNLDLGGVPVLLKLETSICSRVCLMHLRPQALGGVSDHP